MAVKLGDRARDIVSGFEGIVVAKIQYLTGCDRYSLEGKHVLGAKAEDYYQTFDASRLELIEAGAIKLLGHEEPVKNSEHPSGNAPG